MGIRFALIFALVLPPWALSSLSAIGAGNDCEHDQKTFRCVKYLKNYDADTITFNIPNVHAIVGKNISVRVRDLDAPEIKGKNPCEKDAARTAKRLVANLLRNAKRIELQNCGRDKYFRLLCSVQYDGQDLGQVLFKNRLSYSYNGGTKKKVDWCQYPTKSRSFAAEFE